MIAEGKQFVRHVVPAIVKPLRVLWNELIAFIFIAFGVLVASSTWQNFNGGQTSGSPLVLLAGGGFALLLFFYGVSSIVRARRIGKS